jgi:hypothetical protein
LLQNLIMTQILAFHNRYCTLYTLPDYLLTIKGRFMQHRKGFLVWLAGLSVLGFLATDMLACQPSRPFRKTCKRRHPQWCQPESVPRGFRDKRSCCGGHCLTAMAVKPILLAGLTIFAIGYLSGVAVGDGTALLVLRFVPSVPQLSHGRRWSLTTIQRIGTNQCTIMPLVELSPALAPLWQLAVGAL